jgi:hypothetical protein
VAQLPALARDSSPLYIIQIGCGPFQPLIQRVRGTFSGVIQRVRGTFPGVIQRVRGTFPGVIQRVRGTFPGVMLLLLCKDDHIPFLIPGLGMIGAIPPSLTRFHGGHRDKFTLLPICTRGRKKKRGLETLSY